MRGLNPDLTEQIVEYVALFHSPAIGAATKRGSEIDAGGKRHDALQVVLAGRLGTAVHRINLSL